MIGLVLMVFNATFNNNSVISWLSVLLVDYPEKTTDLSQVTYKIYLIMQYTSSLAGSKLASVVIGTDCIGSCKSKYYTIKAMMTPGDEEVTITHGISTINVITVRDPPPYGHAPTYQISLTYLESKKCYGPDKKILFKKQLFDLEVKVPRRSIRFVTHRLMVMHPHSKYN